MAAPTLRATPDTSTASSATSVVIDKHPSLADGDLMLLVLRFNSTNPGTFTWPSGFTGASNNLGNPTLGYAYKDITNASGEPASYTVSWTNSVAVVTGHGLAVVGADNADPIDVTGATLDAFDTVASLAAITTTVADTLIILSYGAQQNPRTISSPPLSATNHSSRSEANLSSNIWSASFAGPGNTGSLDATWNGNASNANYVLAIAPATFPGDPPNLQTSVVDDDVTLTWDSSF